MTTENYFVTRFNREINILNEEISNNGKLITLKSNYPSEYNSNNKLPLFLYGKSKKAIIFLHGTGNKNLKYLKWFPENIAKFGYKGAMMILPYHFERTPENHKSGELFLDPDRVILRDRFENALVDCLTVIDYLQDFCDEIYIMGYSFGGFIAAMAAAMDKRIKKVSLVVTGGNFYHITWKSFVTKVLRVRYEEEGGCDIETCKKYHGDLYKKYLDSLKNPFINIDSAPICCMEYDPLTYAKFINQPTIIFKALFDIFIPSKSTNELHEEIENSQMKRIPSGHLSSILFKRYILKKTINFFQRTDLQNVN